MRFTLLMAFMLLFAGAQSLQAQSCCAKGKSEKTASTATTTPCESTAKANSSTAQANQLLETAGLVQFIIPASTASNPATGAKSCDPAKCDPTKCDHSKCDMTKCDLSKCDPSQCEKSGSADAKGSKKRASKA
ncbi:MAG: hypothetical protein IPH16_01805 [Haliscomenobacter sp.]|nr:hypothetical protein [Haliscomenobacter sp.]MBK7477232.1 hypothetical protein [Haliscomenobacter sp.]